jgi:hypothetical protein
VFGNITQKDWASRPEADSTNSAAPDPRAGTTTMCEKSADELDFVSSMEDAVGVG